MRILYLRNYLLVITFALLLPNITLSQVVKEDHAVIICPAQGLSYDTLDDFPDFNSNDCITTRAGNIDPQYKQIWIKINIDINQYLLDQSNPLALYIMGKASSIVYFNGVLIGKNGNPSSSLKSEVSGLLDSVFYIDKNITYKNNNQLIIRMSAQKGFLHLTHPISRIAIGVYNNPTNALFRYYWITLLPFGAFILAAMYLGVLSFVQKKSKTIIFLALMPLFAACQLLVEVSRGLVAYHYLFHEFRLILIVIFSFVFGICLFSHIMYKFTKKYKIPAILTVVLTTFIIVVIVGAYDLKASLAIIIPAFYSLLICIFHAIKNKPHALSFCFVIIVFILLFFLSPSLFLDRYFYYVVASLLTFLFAQQAIDLSNERNIRENEKSRADYLQLIIEQNSEKVNSAKLKIKSAGKLNLITVDQIAYCKGAGDYVEIVMLDGKNVLHYGTLKELALSMPAIFLKIHRSYIVNTTHIVALNRSNTGSGNLQLCNEIVVPVSRRIMPKIRSVLS